MPREVPKKSSVSVAAAASSATATVREEANKKSASDAAEPPLQLNSITSALKHHVITQIATHLEENNSSSSHAQILSEASQDFPFLKDVDWDLERGKIRVKSGGSTTIKSKPVGQSSQPSSKREPEESKRQHSPKNDFPKARGATKYKMAGKEKAAASATTDKVTMEAIANSILPTVRKIRIARNPTKRRQDDAPRENPYARSWSTSGRTTATSKRAALVSTSVVAETEKEADNHDISFDPFDDNDKDDSLIDDTPKTPSLDRAARAARRAAAATELTNTAPTKDSDPSPTRRKRRKIVEDASSSSGSVNDEEDAKAKSVSRSGQKKRKRKQADYDSDEWTPPEEEEVNPRRQWKRSTKFEERLELCRAFKANNGHLNIPTSKQKAGGDDDCGLAKWADTMRSKYRDFLNDEIQKGAGSKRQQIGKELEVLEDMGFDFEGTSCEQGTSNHVNSTHRRVWDYRVAQCRQFKAEHGHMNIPSSDKELGNFVSRVRSLYQRRLEGDESLTHVEKEKVRQLEDLGFAFDGVFDVNLQRFIEYKKDTGESKVPRKYARDQKLASWARNVRRENNRLNKGEKSDYLTIDRLRKLATAGFGFGEAIQREPPWEEMFEKLRAYRAEHCKDPQTSHEELGYWVTKQRANYTKKKDGNPKHFMTDEREEKLRGIGFVFRAGPRPSNASVQLMRASKKKTFDDRVAEFIAWKEKHGHPYVPTVTGEDKHLGNWVARTRMAYRAFKGEDVKKTWGKLTAEQALKLSQAGFAFDASHIRRTPKDKQHQECEEQDALEWSNYEHNADPFV